MKKLFSAVAMGVIAALCVGSTAYAYPTPSYQVDPVGSPVVMTVNGDPVYANEYASYLSSAKIGFESQFTQMGIDPAMLWGDEAQSAQMIDSITADAQYLVKQYHVINQQFQNEKLKLNRNQIDQIRQQREMIALQWGGEEVFQQVLASQGLTDQMYHNILVSAMQLQALNQHYFGANGMFYVSDEALLSAFQENYVQVKHILISTRDENYEPLDADGQAQKKALAEDVLKKAQDGEDFDALIAQYGEDPGVAQQPNGYIVGRADADFDPAFRDGAVALEEGQLSDLVASDFGYHIIRREPLDESQLPQYKQLIAFELTGKDMTTLLQSWTEEAEATLVEEELAKVTIQNALEIAVGTAEDAPAEDAPAGDAPAEDGTPADANAEPDSQPE